jgi:predicted nucleic acid-binding Zn ribbon protein
MSIKSSPTPIKEVLKHAVAQAANQQKTQERITRAWLQAAGSEAGKHATPQRLTGTRLVVAVDSPVWIYQLNTQRSTLEKAITKKLNLSKQIKIILRAGDVHANHKKGRL